MKKYYSLNYENVDLSDLFKSLNILSSEGSIVFINPSKYILEKLKHLYIGNTMQNDIYNYYDLDESDTIFEINYCESTIEWFMAIDEKDFDTYISFEHCFYFDINKMCLLEWIGAGKYTHIHVLFDHISDNTIRDFCRALYLNNYHVNFFSYIELDS